MAMDDCIHGLAIGSCSTCNPGSAAEQSRAGSYGWQGGETKQDVLDDVCKLLGVPMEPVSVGSSLPSSVFAEAARQVGVPSGSMPEICEYIVVKAGLPWSQDFDSRASPSGGGSTVTLEGLQALRRALRILLA